MCVCLSTTDRLSIKCKFSTKNSRKTVIVEERKTKFNESVLLDKRVFCLQKKKGLNGELQRLLRQCFGDFCILCLKSL